MPPRELNFCPKVRPLESRRCLAAGLGTDPVAATPEEPAQEVGECQLEIHRGTDVCKGDTGNSEGTSPWNSESAQRVDDYFAAVGRDANGGNVFIAGASNRTTGPGSP